METKAFMKDYYETHDENSRFSANHGKVEYLTTLRYIEKYLRPGMRILEIGAATGRYSHALAQRGYRVDAVELIEHNIEIFRQNTLENEPVTITQGNATDLRAFKDNTYDITLLLGPMYHLFTEEDKLKALSEAIRVTKRGGLVYVAYCMSDATVLHFAFMRGEIHNVIEKKMLDPETFKTFSSPQDVFEMHRKEDIDALRAHFPVTQLHYVATDALTHYIRQTVDEMDEKTYALYLKYHFSICERLDMTGFSNHTLDIFRKDE